MAEDLDDFNTPAWSLNPPRTREWYYKSTAVFKGVDYLPLSSMGTYKESRSWNVFETAKHRSLLSLGTKYGALKFTILACHLDNNDFCVFKSSGYTVLERPYYDRERGENRIHTDAVAEVEGFRIEAQAQ